MSSASSNQSCVHEGTGYDEVFPSGQNDPNTSSENRDSSTTSPSRDEEMDRSEDDYSDGLGGGEPPIQSIIGLDGSKEFIMLPLWTGDGDATPEGQQKIVEKGTHHLEDVQIVEEKEDAPVVQ
nr:hypothetical protein CFP56_18361 [Quercus suber]